MPDRAGGLDAWLREFVDAQSDDAKTEAWAERTTALIVAEVPQVAEDAALTHAVRISTRAHWRSFLRHLAEPDREFRLVPPAADLARDLARRGQEVAVLFAIYRIGQRAVWQFITSVVAEVPGGIVDAAGFLTHFWSRASAWLDASVEESLQVFAAEQDRIRQGVAAEQLVTVRELLAGRSPDARELAVVLGGYPVSGVSTAVLLHTEDHDAVADLDEAARRLARTLSVKHPLVVNPGGRDRWVWLGTRSAPELDRLREASGWLQDHGIQACVGTPGAGLDGFRLSHREAHEAQRIAFRAARSPALCLYAEVELLALMAASAEAADRFVRRTLGALAEPGEGPARLRLTLQTLLRTGGADAAARELSVHKNTVRYRAAQAEALLGRPLAEATTEVELALRYHAMFAENAAG